MFFREHTTPIYFAQEVCDATGVPMLTLQNWTSGNGRRLIIAMDGSQGERIPGGRGRHKLFTLMRVYQLAITKDLVELGLDPSHAAGAALRFTDMSAGRSGWGGDRDAAGADRLPGQLFDQALGDTYLLIDRGPRPDPGQPASNARCVALPDDLPLNKLNSKKYFPSGRFGTVLPVNPIIASTRKALGLDWRQPPPGPDEVDLFAKFMESRRAIASAEAQEP